MEGMTGWRDESAGDRWLLGGLPAQERHCLAASLAGSEQEERVAPYYSARRHRFRLERWD